MAPITLFASLPALPALQLSHKLPTPSCFKTTRINYDYGRVQHTAVCGPGGTWQLVMVGDECDDQRRNTPNTDNSRIADPPLFTPECELYPIFLNILHRTSAESYFQNDNLVFSTVASVSFTFIMEAHARAPDPLTKDGDMASNWQTWKEDFLIFMKVTGYIDKSNEIRANLLKNRIGKVGIEAIQNMSFDNMQDRDDMDILIKKLEEYFNPPKKEVVERYHFFTRSKRQNESIEQYINILKEKAKTCNFNDMTESVIRDKIILDTHDKILRKKFFEADDLDLLKLVAIYNDYNINTEKMKQVTAENKAEPTRFPQKPPDNNAKRVCWRCNHQHPLGKCFAWGSKCTKCGDINHFTQCCKGFKFKMSDNKVNKNLLDSVQQTKFIPKTNNKWNNEADSAVKTMDSMTKMTSLPDIPTSSNAANPAVGNDPASDFVILNTSNLASNTSSKLCYDNTTTYSAHLPKNTQYNYSYMKEVKPNGIVTDLYNRSENIQPKQTQKTARVDAAQVPTDFLRHVTKHKAANNTPTFRKERKKKSDEDACVLS
ncbi:uncharacterized protein LOC112467741 isoform X3 [Temnothorax curvispinosus]|uniref:Uncharacterized protein LOC112467741 isoform X3 n=1 Tax=Temnothorax curvispinosus TaxID=300111 RepID=A0A6J1RHU6_9HYME|nr:uncharacterized protein LOC112467741 isoform X3 [Temnothorax curvispinosus]